MAKLTDKVALITGASSGIGKGIAEVYAEHGAKLILVDISEEIVNFAEELKEDGHQVLAEVADVRSLEDLKSAVNKGIERFGTIHVLVANAGVCKLDNFLEMSDKNRDYHIDVNIKGAWNTIKAVLPEMKKNDYGNIVITSSVTGDMVADPGETAYALSKSALVGLTKSLAVEYAQNNIRVNAICPGYVRTPMAESIAEESNPEDPESVLSEMAKAIPMQRLAEPKEVGELAAFLGSDESSYMTGTQNVIDGGSTLPESVSVGT
ncbi:3-oxoacyl-[acyl-carrier protein] reductase [Halanaerobium saccharolyticum subsp. saccharolyticum DSM 6643]|uniref:3-oxoacyl-[acyl-carrier protein] reductase n=1 Tax=Halanaerobium saccharolyticum subsp. saccharolyticum DSM 6643 TaxID=1293054 RepID=M5E0J9_9FIRM|nr:SDR family oxidoreductase UcpA [Halanaerobium saccharolyticum]CCU79292.1 3-oxoacyl-[acyl-carrier protein] reductase [Halanaerobium saccharolyticum subsp. saccharolyticum DSM 6643]